MNFFNRFQGVFFNPQSTFKSLAERPVWIDVLVVVLIAFMIFAYLIAPYQQKDQIKIWENSTKLRERMGEENYQQRMETLKNPPKWQKIIGVVLAPIGLLVGLLISSLVILLMGRMGSLEGKYVQVFSALLHANLVDKILGNALKTFLISSKGSVVQTTTSLAMLFPNLDISSPAYIILGQFDFFQLWLFGILGFGLSAIFKIPMKRAVFISYLFWLIKSVLGVALWFISMSFVS
jgi:hypothetical protein